VKLSARDSTLSASAKIVTRIGAQLTGFGRSSTTSCQYDGGLTGPRDYQFLQTKFEPGRAGPTTVAPASQQQVALSTVRLQALEEKLERLTSAVQALQENSSAASSAYGGQLSGAVPSSVTSLHTSPDASDEALQESSAGHLLVQSAGGLHFVSRGHWAAMCDEAKEIRNLLKGQARYDIMDTGQSRQAKQYGSIVSAPPAWELSGRTTSKFRQSVPLQNLKIPERTTCDALLEAFIFCFHPVAPLTHIPTLRNDYNTFWELHECGWANDGSISVPFILSALYAGAVVCQHPALEETIPGVSDMNSVATEIYREATNALYLAHFPRTPTVSNLAAYMILQGTWMREEEPLTTCSFVGVAVRVAQMLGLHKDPSHFASGIDAIQGEVQRRVWWHVFYCDVLVAMASGLPPLIEQDSWDTRMVSDLREECFGTAEGLQYDQTVQDGRRQSISTSKGLPLASPLGIWLKGKFHEAST
jgi:hypothetical protein